MIDSAQKDVLQKIAIKNGIPYQDVEGAFLRAFEISAQNQADLQMLDFNEVANTNDFFDSGKFVIDILFARKIKKQSLREAAKSIGIDASTLSRIENGGIPDLASYGKICFWLGLGHPKFFIKKRYSDEY